MLKIAFHPEYIHPVREGHRFPMEKYELIPLQLLHEGVVRKENFFEPALASFETACLAHDPIYVRDIFDLTLNAKMIRRIGFPLTKSIVDRERYLVDGTIQCALYALKYNISFNIAGGTHHAGYDFGEGFCLLNDQAVAARYLLNKQLANRILIIDLDVHQGNGTAHIFRDDDRVFTYSIHGDKNFPFIKEQSDLDIPVADGLEDDVYLQLLGDSLPLIFKKVKPDFVFYQAGVDILATDKLGKLKLSPEACRMRDEFVFTLCVTNKIPVQVSMGGGYSMHIRDIVNAHCQTFKIAVDLYNF